MKKERIKKTSTVFFAITVTALIAVALITASQHASEAVVHHKVAVHHKVHTASKGIRRSIGLQYKRR
jgi:Spy/CpxP family protein refolding chaperone